MDKMDSKLFETKFSIISDHILTNRQKEIDDAGYRDYDYHGIRKGFIIADDESGEILERAKKSLRYDDLKKAGKIHELEIDDSWDRAFRKTNGMSGREAWNGLVMSAYKANHGLLMVTISNIKTFSHCWELKLLAKQENPLVPWEPVSRGAMKPFDIEFVKSHVPLEFMFDGNVFLVLKDMTWDEVKRYAEKNNAGQFHDMLRFYYVVK